MNKEDRVVKHLEMIQGVVNRLGSNSFMLKGWSMAIIVSAMILISRYGIQNNFIMLAFIIPISGFWILDGYFLRQGKLFRHVYNEIRQQEETDFAMDVKKHIDKPKCNLTFSIFSTTLNIFYGIEIVFVLSVFCILK